MPDLLHDLRTMIQGLINSKQQKAYIVDYLMSDPMTNNLYVYNFYPCYFPLVKESQKLFHSTATGAISTYPKLGKEDDPGHSQS